MKRRIAEFRQGYETSSSTASPVPKEAAYKALPGTAPRPKGEPPAETSGQPHAKAVPTEAAGRIQPCRAPGSGDDGGGDDQSEYTLETIDEEEGEEEEDRGEADPLVLIEGTAISWQLKVFVSLENETMEDVLLIGS